MATQPKFKRVLLKLSGEALKGSTASEIDGEAVAKVVSELAELNQAGVSLGIVVGGGNIFRGVQQGPKIGINRVAADQMGMYATYLNGIALKHALLNKGIDTRMLSPFESPFSSERFEMEKAMRQLQKGRVLIFVGGTGHPFFTTDTNAALRACEIGADLLLKATMHVDGVYDKDPIKEKGAKRYSQISYSKALEEKVGVLDLTAVTLCLTNKIPIRVFKLFSSSLLDAVSDKDIGTLVTGE